MCLPFRGNHSHNSELFQRIRIKQLRSANTSRFRISHRPYHHTICMYLINVSLTSSLIFKITSIHSIFFINLIKHDEHFSTTLSPLRFHNVNSCLQLQHFTSLSSFIPQRVFHPNLELLPRATGRRVECLSQLHRMPPGKNI